MEERKKERKGEEGERNKSNKVIQRGGRQNDTEITLFLFVECSHRVHSRCSIVTDDGCAGSKAEKQAVKGKFSLVCLPLFSTLSHFFVVVSAPRRSADRLSFLEMTEAGVQHRVSKLQRNSLVDGFPSIDRFALLINSIRGYGFSNSNTRLFLQFTWDTGEF